MLETGSPRITLRTAPMTPFDGAIAAVMAFGQAFLSTGPPAAPSVYESRGILVL